MNIFSEIFVKIKSNDEKAEEKAESYVQTQVQRKAVWMILQSQPTLIPLKK